MFAASGRAEGQRIHHGLADELRARIEQPLQGLCAELGRLAVERPGRMPGPGDRALDLDVVLGREREAGEGTLCCSFAHDPRARHEGAQAVFDCAHRPTA